MGVPPVPVSYAYGLVSPMCRRTVLLESKITSQQIMTILRQLWQYIINVIVCVDVRRSTAAALSFEANPG